MNVSLMPPFFDQHQSSIDEVCGRFGVKRLEAFGSVLRGDFSPSSDVDFLVQFDESVPDAFDCYFGLKEGLELIVARPVDLVVADSIKNPIFRAEVTQTKYPVYVAA